MHRRQHMRLLCTFNASQFLVAPQDLLLARHGSLTQTIPRLELLSALLLSKLMDNVSRALSLELPLGEPSYFTYSKVSLYWIQGQDKEWKPFVQNRVNQIRSVTQTSTLCRQGKPCRYPF